MVSIKLGSPSTQSGSVKPMPTSASAAPVHIRQVEFKARAGRTIYPEPYGHTAFSAEKRLPGLADLQIVPQVTGSGIEYFHVETKTEIGGFQSSAPLVVGSYGTAKVAEPFIESIYIGAARAGIPVVIGENTLATYGDEGLKKRLQVYLENFTGKGAAVVQVNENDMKNGVVEIARKHGAHAIEIKLGQGAESGLGGAIRFEGKELADKFAKMGYTIIERPDGKFERHSKPMDVEPTGLKKIIDDYTDLGIPIWIKTFAGADLQTLLKTIEKIKEVKCVTIDGHGGSTGMSPLTILNEVGIHPGAALKDAGKYHFSILLSGGIWTGTDVAKAIMLGADGVAMGRPFMIAAGTELRDRGVENFVRATKEELQMVCATQKASQTKELKGKRENLYAITDSAARMFGL